MNHEAGMDEMGTARVASEGHSEGVKGQEAVSSQAPKADPVKPAAAKKAPAKKPAPAPEVTQASVASKTTPEAAKVVGETIAPKGAAKPPPSA